tara:strand:- start:99 stop:386 length:288 start_codon:yes stop_codon:yes gene_type:complete
MKFYPRNRHILIEVIKDNKEGSESESRVLLPEGYGEKTPPYVCAVVKEISPSCTTNVGKGDKVIVESSMIQELSVDDHLYTIVLENYIYGVISSR